MNAAGADRPAPVLLTVDPGAPIAGSWVGGAMPECLLSPQRSGAFDRHLDLLTLSAHLPAMAAGPALTILLREGFAVYQPDTEYPDIGVACVVHEVSPPDPAGTGRTLGMDTGALVAIPAGDPDVPYLVKVGGTPDLIQDPPPAARRLAGDGFRFLLQVDDNGFPDGFVTGDYPFGFGALYVFARAGDGGGIADVVAGFTQFS